MWILGMMFFVSCSDDDNGGTGGGNGDKDALFRDHPDATVFGIVFHHCGGFRDVLHNREVPEVYALVCLRDIEIHRKPAMKEW